MIFIFWVILEINGETLTIVECSLPEIRITPGDNVHSLNLKPISIGRGLKVVNDYIYYGTCWGFYATFEANFYIMRHLKTTHPIAF